MSYQLTYAQGPGVLVMWDRILPFVEKINERDITWKTDDILEMIMGNKAVAWLVSDGDDLKAVVITRNVEYRMTGKFIEVMMTAGEDFKGWIGMVMEALKRYVSQEDALGLRAFCRPGMAKWLKGEEWNQLNIIMEWKSHV